MTTFHPSDGPQDVIRGEATSSTRHEGSTRYVRSEPLTSPRPGAGRTPFGLGGSPLRLPRTSLVTAAVAALVLGPLGMLYATFLGAFVMAGVVFWSGVLGGIDAVVYAWLVGVAWAVWAAHRRNQRLARVEEQVGFAADQAFRAYR